MSLRSRERYSRRSPAGGRSPDRSRRENPPAKQRLEKPELYGCYRGRVSGMMDFGAFVELLGFPGRCEGLVHLSNMAASRPSSAKEVVSRGQVCLHPPLIRLPDASLLLPCPLSPSWRFGPLVFFSLHSCLTLCSPLSLPLLLWLPLAFNPLSFGPPTYVSPPGDHSLLMSSFGVAEVLSPLQNSFRLIGLTIPWHLCIHRKFGSKSSRRRGSA